MLGWEFPPFISGGLGTACHGLTRALSRQHTTITFVLPRSVASETHDTATDVRILSPQSLTAQANGLATSQLTSTALGHKPQPSNFTNVIFKTIPSRLTNPYQSPAKEHGGLTTADTPGGTTNLTQAATTHRSINNRSNSTADSHYGGDLLQEIRRYASMCVQLAHNEFFDVVHAHDWMTYPAGMAIAAVTGKPLVVHVHSTEFDRSGPNVNRAVYDIERRGMHAACCIIAVSYMTKSIVEHRYGITGDKIEVVYNGIDNGHTQPITPRTEIRRGDKIVLFLGRITMQKGPEYFVEAARKVLKKYDTVKFVMAGSGDMVREVIDLAEQRGIGQKVIFTGFLRGPDVERVFKMADVYVMPSVSEPFGIAPLEAIRHDVPVVISKQSGVSEVLTHVLKVDFWDTDEIANKIIAVLRHPPLSSTLREHADLEVRRLTWDDAAAKCRNVYRQAIAMMPV